MRVLCECDSFVHWLANYVMISRLESLRGLLTLRLPERKQLETGAPAYLVEEMDRLLQLEKRSLSELRQRALCKEGFLPTRLNLAFL